jgi:hypothetical protein
LRGMEQTYIVGALLQDLVTSASGAVARDLAADLRNSVKSCDSNQLARASRQRGRMACCLPPILYVKCGG